VTPDYDGDAALCYVPVGTVFQSNGAATPRFSLRIFDFLDREFPDR